MRKFYKLEKNQQMEIENELQKKILKIKEMVKNDLQFQQDFD